MEIRTHEGTLSSRDGISIMEIRTHEGTLSSRDGMQ